MNPTPISFDSPLYPLPADYYELTAEGQRKARINACRQWMIPAPRTRDLSALVPTARRRVASHKFFDDYYLMVDEENHFDPGFYDMTPLPSPEMHWDMVRMWAIYRKTLTVLPRGSAKSTRIRIDDIMKMVTAPIYSIVYASSSQDNAAGTSEINRSQIYENTRIQADWGPEYDVTSLKPTRGSKSTGSQHFYVNNGSHMRCVSASSRLRGIRPRRFRLDDPEYDGTASTSPELLREYMEQLLFKIAIPALMRSGAGIDWTATFVSRRHYAWHATNIVEGPDGPQAEDPRFNSWARNTVKLVETDDKGCERSCWPEMWPMDSKERDALKLPLDTQTVEEIRDSIGVAAFNSEYMASPGTGDDQYFQLDHQPRGRHAWWLTEIDPAYTTDPRNSLTKINWYDSEKETERSQTISQFLSDRMLFATLDTAYTETATSDRRCVVIMAWRPQDNDLFVLDAYSNRTTDSTLVNEALKRADRWKCPVLYPEVVRDSIKLYQRLNSIVQTRTGNQMGFGFIPTVRPLKVGHASKTAKIEALDVRVEHGLVKLPIFERHKNPAIRRLIDQFDGFAPFAKDGGLENDDEIDCLAMSMFVLKGRLREAQKAQTRVRTVDEMVEEGDYQHNGWDVRMVDPTSWHTAGDTRQEEKDTVV